ncbi:hypothetical protein HKX48_003490 [Thoreauomyces humboldtii]|nr:hypothetical protein HKX48_003490 [Thoreauomyces humboldtii]
MHLVVTVPPLYPRSILAAPPRTGRALLMHPKLSPLLGIRTLLPLFRSIAATSTSRHQAHSVAATVRRHRPTNHLAAQKVSYPELNSLHNALASGKAALCWKAFSRIKDYPTLSQCIAPADYVALLEIILKAPTGWSGRTRAFRVQEVLRELARNTKVANATMLVLGRKDADAARQTLDILLRHGTADGESWLYLLRRACDARRFDQVDEAFDQMVQARVKPSLRAFNFVLHSMAQHGIPDRVFALWDRWKGVLPPSEPTYGILLTAVPATKAGAMTEDGLLEEMEAQGIDVDEQHFTILMENCLRRDDLPRAERWFREMCDAGFEPNFAVWRAIIRLKISNGDEAEAEHLFSRMSGRVEMAKMPAIYYAYINAYAKVGAYAMSLHWIARARDDSVPLSQFGSPYTPLIQRCIATAGIDAAVQVFECIPDRDLGPQDVAFEPFIKFYTAQSDLPNARAWFARIEASGRSPSAVTYHQILNAYAKRGELLEVIDWYKQMRNAGIEEDATTLTILMNACSFAQHFDTAFAVWNTLKTEYKATMSDASLSVFVDLCGFSGNLRFMEQELRELSRVDGGSLDQNVYNSIIEAYARNAEFETAKLVLFEAMPQHAVAPTYKTLQTLFTPLRNAGRIREAHEVEARFYNQFPYLRRSRGRHG